MSYRAPIVILGTAVDLYLLVQDSVQQCALGCHAVGLIFFRRVYVGQTYFDAFRAAHDQHRVTVEHNDDARSEFFGACKTGNKAHAQQG